MSDINAAITAYLGYHRATVPQSDWRAVFDLLGRERAQAIELPMLAILSDLCMIEPDWHDHSLYSGSEWAVRALRARHPEIDDRAAKALVWRYSYDKK